MRLLCPLYYKEFKCIADRCRHSCCVGWEIEVDRETLKKYKAQGAAAARVLSTVKKQGGSHCFIMDGGGRCKNLRADGLCSIIIELGEEYLPEICKEHPRFYNAADEIGSEAYEVGLGMACEEAARIILKSEDYSSIISLEDGALLTEEEIEGERGDCLNFYYQRKRIYRLLSDESMLTLDKLSAICDHFGAAVDKIPEGNIRELLSSLEYLDEGNRELFSRYKHYAFITGEGDKYLERFFAYLVYRHIRKASDKRELAALIGALTVLTRLFASLTLGESLDECINTARVISEEIEYSTDNLDQIAFYISMFGML